MRGFKKTHVRGLICETTTDRRSAKPSSFGTEGAPMMTPPMNLGAASNVDRAHALVVLLYDYLDSRDSTDVITRLTLDSIGAFLGYAQAELAQPSPKDDGAVQAVTA